MTVQFIHAELAKMGSFYDVYVPEFSFDGIRIDGAMVNIQKRWVRGFEIKVDRSDWVGDKKWTLYSKFCSSLSVVCPQGLIEPEEVGHPFGLLWIGERGKIWKKKPKNYQKRDCLAWLWTYVSVIEKELPRLNRELNWAKNTIERHGINDR